MASKQIRCPEFIGVVLRNPFPLANLILPVPGKQDYLIWIGWALLRTRFSHSFTLVLERFLDAVHFCFGVVYLDMKIMPS